MKNEPMMDRQQEVATQLSRSAVSQSVHWNVLIGNESRGVRLGPGGAAGIECNCGLGGACRARKLGWRQDNGNRSNQKSKSDFWPTRQCLAKIDEGQQKIKIVRTTRGENGLAGTP